MIKQFTINLNKGEGEQLIRLRRQERRAYLVLALFVILFLVLGGLTWAQNEAINDVIAGRQAKLDRIRFELDSLKREGTKVSKDDVIALARLENERFLWAKRLEKLAEILPSGMALTELVYENEILNISAVAQVDPEQKEFDQVSSFIDLLKTTPEFRSGFFEIRLHESIRRMVEEQDVVEFTIECLTSESDVEKRRRRSRG
jgi:Tfp pilus assembly protein PilN